MAHYQQLKFVQEVKEECPEYFNNKLVLEIGSWDTNGSVRNFFNNCNYTGVDVSVGPGVDVVCEGQNLKFEDMKFDTVISCECFEHNPYWKETFLNMIRMLKPGGLCVVTCATLGRREHGTLRTNPNASLTALNDDSFEGSYYRNLRQSDLASAVSLDKHFSDYRFYINVYSRDLYFVGYKKSLGNSPGKQFSAKLSKNIKSIRKEKKSTNAISHFFKTIKFWITYCYAWFLGEKKFHDKRLKKY